MSDDRAGASRTSKTGARAEPDIPSARRPKPAAASGIAGLQAACASMLAAAGKAVREAMEKPSAGAHAAAPTSPPQVSGELAWVSGSIATAQSRSRRAEDCHNGASQRVDSALYELEQLRRELEAVIDPSRLPHAQPAAPPAPSADAPAMVSPAPAARSAA